MNKEDLIIFLNVHSKDINNNKNRIDKKTFSELPTDLQIRFLYKYSGQNFLNPLFKIVDTNKKMAKFLLNRNLLDKISIEQMQSFDLSEFDDDMLIKLAKSPSITNLSDEQIGNDSFINIFYLLNPTDLRELVFKLYNRFKGNQIQAIKVNDPETAVFLLKERPNDLSLDQIKAINTNHPQASAYLLLKRPEDITRKQIHIMNFDSESPMNQIIKPNNRNKNGLYIIRRFHQYKDLSDEQFNNFLHYYDTNVIKEILYEDLQGKITIKNIKRIHLDDIFDEIDVDAYKKLFKACYMNFSNEQIHSLRTENEIIANLIIMNSLYDKLTDEQKNNFNKNELLKCNENQLIYILSAPCRIQIDTIITGLLMYKYFNEAHCSIELNNIMRNIIQVYCSDIILAKFILIIENEFSDLKRFQFSQISKKFFEEMNQNNLNIFNKLKNNQTIKLTVGNALSISPNDLVKIICEKLSQMSINDAQSILEQKYKLFSILPQNHKESLQKLSIGYDAIEGKYKIVSFDTNNSNSKPQGFISRFLVRGFKS